ncbi:MAG: hypothetical protein HDR11_17005 [Lachnospiraceae bacterium]|nr:hypothetical protein [Lachnospiraceae bacterium]
MAMEINGNLSDYAVRKQNYSSYAAQSAGSNMASSKSKSTSDYANELAKLAPSVEFKVGNSFSTAKSGKTLTVNPNLLEKMQNDPEQAKETKELIRGVESATKLMDGIYKASGWTVVYRHSYIDENGKYCAIACVRNDFMLNMSDKLREERKKNSEELIEKAKEKAQEESAYNKAEQLLEEKIASSKDGTIYLYDTDMKTIIEAAKEENAGKTSTKQQTQVGANMDLKA